MSQPQEPVVGMDQVLTVDEGARIKRDIVARNEAKQWRWMGNYGDPFQAAAVANQDPPCVGGELICSVADNGLVPTWMYY